MKSLLTAFLVTLFAFNAHGQTNRSTVRKSLSSVCFLMLQDKDDQPKKLGSGFFIKPGVIATSLPLLDGVASGYCKVAGSRTRHKIQGVIARDTVNQVALLQTDRNAAPSLTLTNDLVLTGDEATVLACPKGLNGEFRNGTISGVHTKGDNKFYEITSDILPSMDGGPVINDNGKAIGMAASFVVDGKSHTIVIPSYVMADLLGKTGSPSFQQANTTTKPPNTIQLGKGVVVDKLQEGTNTGSVRRTIRYRITNNLNEEIKGVKFIIIVRDSDGSVKDTVTIKNTTLNLAPGLASVKDSQITETFSGSIRPKGGYDFKTVTETCEIRVLEVQRETDTSSTNQSKKKNKRGLFNR